MRTLTLEHLAAYLPYAPKVYHPSGHYIGKLGLINTDIEVPIDTVLNLQAKPVLRPLSDLTKEIEHNGKKIVPLYELMREDRAFIKIFIETYFYEELKVSVYELLLEWHFDIFGLIDAGLAVDTNTLKTEK